MSQPTLPSSSANHQADQNLAARVRNFLTSKTFPRRSDLDVAATGGTVTLRGNVGSFYQKQLCIHGAQRVAGVHRVVDELQVLQS